MTGPEPPATTVGQRRASYGATSPRVGVRGARTRERIVGETLGLFSSLGFHETTVREISEAADVSRATLYQYFESKEQIFVELLEECGSALVGVTRRIGPLGPTEQGYANLRRWLVDWTGVYEKYGTLFVQWTTVDLPGSAVRGLVAGFLGTYHRRVAELLRSAGLAGLEALDASVLVTSVVHRFNYLRFASPTVQPDVAAAVLDVAVVLQLTLFPSTPAAVIAHDGPGTAGASEAAPESAVPRRRSVTRAKWSGLTARSAATVRRIMDAGALCFAESGFYGANVDEIVTRAGFARGTFYKYFTEKLDLLLVLSDECEDELFVRIGAFTAIPVGESGAAERRDWLAAFLPFRARHIGVIRAWIDRTPVDPTLDGARMRVAAGVHESLTALVGRAPLSGVVSIRAAEIMLIGVLERMPDVMLDPSRHVRPEEIVEVMATAIERGLLGLVRPARGTPAAAGA